MCSVSRSISSGLSKECAIEVSTPYIHTCMGSCTLIRCTSNIVFIVEHTSFPLVQQHDKSIHLIEQNKVCSGPYLNEWVKPENRNKCLTVPTPMYLCVLWLKSSPTLR